MKPQRNIYAITATSATGIAASQTPSGAGALTLNGGLIANGQLVLSVPQFITLTVGANESAKTFTVFGTDSAGAEISETITGPSSASTVTSTKCYKTVTRITVSAALSAACTVGVSGTGEMPWISLDHYKKPFEFSYYASVSGTVTYQIESTLDDVQDNSIVPIVNATLKTSGSSSGGGNSKETASAFRVKITASTGAPTITLNAMQSGR